MILVRRGTLVVMLVIAAALGVGVGSWGASAVDPAKHPDPAPPQQQVAMRAPVVPAALPVASGSFAQVAEAVGPAVVNITTFMRSGGEASARGSLWTPPASRSPTRTWWSAPPTSRW